MALIRYLDHFFLLSNVRYSFAFTGLTSDKYFAADGGFLNHIDEHIGI